ncbi:primosomal protein DnaI [Carnobacterium viridans]|uniref:Replicative DNA helicase loader DnaI n=1 Tax=Carnobacterium viridans TaxID=174587 RepID=A0A1H1BGH6_9LACT|nr:primosomal protein DnaI [Carnobacterium viridans]SDQ50476.1 replicative DNA helicase loader DnaI [Carnobacterium viridans]
MEDIGESLTRMIKERNLNHKYEELIQEVLDDPDVMQFIEDNRQKLDDEAIVKSYAKLYEYVQEKKKFHLNKGMMAPGYHPKLILNYHYIDVTYVPSAELVARQKELEIKNRIYSMDMPKDVRNATLADFELTDERRFAISEVYDFIDAYMTSPKAYHKGLYLQGSFGVGKTYLLGALAHELAKNGFPSTLMHFPSFAVEMKQSIGKNNTGEKLEFVKKAPILMLDDIGADSMSSWIRDDVLGVILQYRMQEQLPTFFSSNFDMKQLEEEHLRVTQRGEDEPLKAKRIMERVRYLAKEVKMTGSNRRHLQ